MSREPLFGIVHTVDGLAVVPAAEVPRRTALMKRRHADTKTAWKRSRIGQESAKLSKRRRIERNNDGYAARVAAWAERRGAA